MADLDYNRKLETPRLGHRIQAFGWALIVLAVTLTAIDVLAHNYAWSLVNLVTFTCGVYNVWAGRRSARRAIEHHRTMEGYRRGIRESQRRLEGFHGPN